ncbi:uncharacterized protein BT62DRAFT_998063 [Guyanagaster necrorhizus]|uniref:Uncharacterized protein n=1 Tax=Guyanagaster necrorhizus TaxID=856835 RepID=A0A9P7VGX7_9AGAR|nr:uncharacterized protein BT62DRAFT_998063 [Guyanagaster necrorhizus MCA 3950]KAG7439886.1 hypothetical protein BT62DRAFT_998063 [Guyanagaster necrorhizus MCA 3950]
MEHFSFPVMGIPQADEPGDKLQSVIDMTKRQPYNLAKEAKAEQRLKKRQHHTPQRWDTEQGTVLLKIINLGRPTLNPPNRKPSLVSSEGREQNESQEEKRFRTQQLRASSPTGPSNARGMCNSSEAFVKKETHIESITRSKAKPGDEGSTYRAPYINEQIGSWGLRDMNDTATRSELPKRRQSTMIYDRSLDLHPAPLTYRRKTKKTNDA